MYTALWWINKGHIPSVAEGKHRFDYLQQHGETSYAFTFKRVFTPSECTIEDFIIKDLDPCSA